MLLITFFMLCTSLSKPQTMEISMPSNDKTITEEQQTKVKASQAITLLLGDDKQLWLLRRGAQLQGLYFTEGNYLSGGWSESTRLQNVTELL